MMVDGAVEFLTNDGLKMALTALPVDQVLLIVAFFFLSILSVNWVLTVLTTIAFYLSLGFMVVCTVQMFKNKRKQREVKSMGTMLNKFCYQVKPDTVETRFLANSMKPYWTFFIFLFVFVPLFYLVNKDWVPCSEFACISWILALLCMFLLSNVRDPLAIISLLLNIISTLPHFTVNTPDNSILTSIVRFITTPMYSMKIMKHFYLNISIPAISNILIFSIIALMAFRSSWKVVASVLIPHLVGFFWWQIGTVFFDFSSWLGLARASMGYVLFVLATPFMTVIGFVYGTYTFFVTVKLLSLMKVLVTLALLLTPILLVVWQGFEYELGGFTLAGRSGKTKIWTFVIIALIASPAAYMATLEDDDEDSSVNYLSWDLYRSYCGPYAWEKSNMAQVQINCLRFRYMQVNWTGIVQRVNITLIENSANDVLDSLPEGLAEWLKCLYGEHYGPCNVTTMSGIELMACEQRKVYGRDCHMRSADSYTFLLVVRMTADDDHDSSQDIHVVASHEFHKVLMDIRIGHEVELQGALVNRIGGFNPVVNLEDIECLNCIAEITGVHAEGKKAQDQAMKEVLQTVSFFTSPLLEYDESRTPTKLRKGRRHKHHIKDEL